MKSQVRYRAIRLSAAKGNIAGGNPVWLHRYGKPRILWPRMPRTLLVAAMAAPALAIAALAIAALAIIALATGGYRP